ncbi:MAG: hypothetical protein QM784_29455 [Polyangiaceae bacterium]
MPRKAPEGFVPITVYIPEWVHTAHKIAASASRDTLQNRIATILTGTTGLDQGSLKTLASQSKLPEPKPAKKKPSRR